MTLEDRKRAARGMLRGALATVADGPRASGAIVERLRGWDRFAGARTVMSFAALPGEADMDGASRAVLARGGRLCLPRVEWATGMMEAREVMGLEGLVEGRFGLREPGADALVVGPAEVDLVLVPGLGFDARGGRLGRGGGFYDRFLAGLADVGGRAGIACGIGFDVQVAEEVPMGPMDIRLGAVATELRLILL